MSEQMKPADAEPLRWYSIGFCCQMIQQPPEVIARLCELAGVEAGLYINLVPHFNNIDLQKMVAEAKRIETEAEAFTSN